MHEQRRPLGKFEADLSAQVCGTSRADPVTAAKMSCMYVMTTVDFFP